MLYSRSLDPILHKENFILIINKFPYSPSSGLHNQHSSLHTAFYVCNYFTYFIQVKSCNICPSVTGF